MNRLLKITITAVVLATFSLDTMAADTPAASHNKIEQRAGKSTGAPGSSSDTTLQQRIEMRKKTKAHWRDPPTGDRASRLKAKRERLEQNTGQTAPAKKEPTDTLK